MYSIDRYIIFWADYKRRVLEGVVELSNSNKFGCILDTGSVYTIFSYKQLVNNGLVNFKLEECQYIKVRSYTSGEADLKVYPICLLDIDVCNIKFDKFNCFVVGQEEGESLIGFDFYMSMNPERLSEDVVVSNVFNEALYNNMFDDIITKRGITEVPVIGSSLLRDTHKRKNFSSALDKLIH